MVSTSIETLLEGKGFGCEAGGNWTKRKGQGIGCVAFGACDTSTPGPKREGIEPSVHTWISEGEKLDSLLQADWNRAVLSGHGMEISVWNMPEWNGMEDFKNGMEDNLPY